MSFMPNAVVFPGGGCDDFDFSDGYLKVLPSTKASQTLTREERGRRIAACREVFEETGMLLIVNDPGVTALTPETRSKWREDVHNDTTKFLDLLLTIKAKPDLDSLHKFANWITPVVEKKRFDTHFYVHVLSSEKNLKENVAAANHDIIESSGSAWARPDDVLEAWRRKKIMLVPPTWHTLTELVGELNHLDTVPARLEKKKIFPILPNFIGFVDSEDASVLALPFDADHPVTTEDKGYQYLSDLTQQRNRVLIRTMPDKKLYMENDKKKNPSSSDPAAVVDDKPQYSLVCNIPRHLLVVSEPSHL
jgi:8-oxo-dGTP pyrophosphatase MutT (NUDIX family)